MSHRVRRRKLLVFFGVKLEFWFCESRLRTWGTEARRESEGAMLRRRQLGTSFCSLALTKLP